LAAALRAGRYSGGYPAAGVAPRARSIASDPPPASPRRSAAAARV